LAGSLLLLVSFPPFGLWPLAFVAPAPWVWLLRQPKLDGPRPYRWIWLGAAIGWLALLQGIRLPHWILYFGWFALSFYAASYVPIFVAIGRQGVAKWRLPLILVAPVVWVGLEFARGFFATGFSIGLVGHPLTAWPAMIQIADLGGAYAVSLVVMIAASSIAEAVATAETKWKPWPLIPLTIALGASWLYGYDRLRNLPPRGDDEGVLVCLLQSNQDVVFVADRQRNVDLFQQCLGQAQRAKRDHPDLQLIIWPESTFSANKPDVIVDGTPQAPAGVEITPEKLSLALAVGAEDCELHQVRTAAAIHEAVPGSRPDAAGTWQFVGTTSMRYGEHPPEHLNTAQLISPLGKTEGRYFKTHRVMFGEYVPLADQLPWIYTWTPMARGLTAGHSPMSFPLDGVVFSPTICFETTVPHLVRRQFRRLASEGDRPDVLLNLTNDGWFWGSSILDLHFACNVFRAVELRRPVLVSANTGITVWLDDCGRKRHRVPRRTPGYLVDRVAPARIEQTVYCQTGDLAWAVCLLISAALALSPLMSRISVSREQDL
jgi:apolipoprotein N-acyltransferase